MRIKELSVLRSRQESAVRMWLLVIAFLVVAGYSTWTLIGTARSIPKVGSALLSILLIIWALSLAVLLVKPLNVAALKIAGAFAPTYNDWQRLEPLWRQAQRRAGVQPGRYALLLVAEDALLHKDLGPYAVAIDVSALDLSDKELAAVLAQRLARQTGWTAPLVALCLWAALPLVLLMGLYVLAVSVIRVIARTFNKTADGLNPKTETQAGIGCLLYAIAAVLLLFMIAIGLTLVIFAGISLVIVVIIAWLARRADVASSAVATSWGYGADLRASLTRPHVEPGIARWLRPISTYGSVKAHIAEIERASAYGHGGDEVER